MRHLFLAAGTALVVACTPSAPGEVPAPDRDVVPVSPPVHALLGYRDRLELSSAQVEAIDSIGTALNLKNADPVRRLREIGRSARPAQPPQDPRTRRDPRYPERQRPISRRVDREELRELTEEVRGNNEEAVTAVSGLLGGAQRERVCDVFERRARHASSRSRTARQGFVWPWCAPEAADEGEDTRSRR